MTAADPAQARSYAPPPGRNLGALEWVRENLFNSWFNSLLTLACLALIALAGRGLLSWAFREANWRVITTNLGVLVWGRYPIGEVWRLALCLGILVLLGALTLAAYRTADGRGFRRWTVVGWILSPVVILLLVRGFYFPTLRTVTNNISYYFVRPELFPLLGLTWRAYAALTLAGLLAGLTLGIVSDRLRSGLAGAAVLAVLVILVPLGLQPAGTVLGLKIPLLVPLLAVLVVSVVAGRNAGRSVANVGGARRALAFGWLLGLLAIVILLTAFDVGVESVAPADVLPVVRPDTLSGILLTLTLAIVSIVASFPIGVLLALGRRSDLPVVKVTCVLFIEIVRGVPLITILFMAQVILPLFLPLELTLDRVVRAMAGMTLFTAAYLAEIVRGGLQAVRHEQVEAARALGLSEVLVTALIVLPQALRTVIPPIMGQFVSIFKDTSLVTIVGLLDLLAVSQSVIKQREFLGAVREVYLFAALFYFVVSYAMSYASQRLEKRLGVA